MPTLYRCTGTKMSRVRASSDRVGRTPWAGPAPVTPLQQKPGSALFLDSLRLEARLPRPRDPKNPPPYPSEIVTSTSYTHQVHVYTHFRDFFNNMWVALNKAPQILLTVDNTHSLGEQGPYKVGGQMVRCYKAESQQGESICCRA
jgi:hypothetical protein